MVGWVYARRLRFALAAGLVVLAQIAPAAVSLPEVGARISGPAEVVDGDSLRMGALRLRLHGIDAPEINQTCTDAQGAAWSCGLWAKAQLRALVADRRLDCTALDHDRYGRLVARCAVAGRDLGAAMVAAGAARAYLRYSAAYLGQEGAARVARRGLWAGAHTEPEHWRRQAAATAKTTDTGANTGADARASALCAIKGNISDGGRIYHRPGQRDYDRVVLTPQRGERWFCTEAEARAAGWRPARH